MHHLVMTLPRFVRLCAEMAGHLRGMQEKGIISRQPLKDGSATPEAPA